jgi:hypothetical protein
VADLKISQLTGGGASQAADEYVIARSGNNFKVTGANVAAAATSVGTLTSLTVSGNATFDTNTLFVDAINNRVGVGTATPDQPLHVNSGSAIAMRLTRGGGTAANLSLEWWNGTKGWYAGISTTGFWGVAYDTAGGGIDSASVRIDTSGNLGLGVTPSAFFTNARVFQFGRAGSLEGRTDDNVVQLQANAFVNSSFVNTYILTAAATRYRQENGVHSWFNAASGTAGNAITFTQAMTLDASGNLMVGGTSSYAAIITAQSTAMRGAGVGFRNSAGTAAGGIFVGAAGSGGGSTDVYVEAAGFLAFNAGGTTERARITTAGSVVAGGSVALATTATDGFLYVPTCAGTPTGTPTAITGMAPIVVDTTNHKLYFRSGGVWRDAGP